jgi:hypothetical protein
MTRSITDDPVAATFGVAGPFPNVAPGPVARAAAFVRAARIAAADGLTWVEVGQLVLTLVRLLVQAYEGVRDMTGEQKKKAVLDAVAELFDAVADRAVPTLAKPLWYVARPAVRSLVLSIADGAVEVVLPLVRG